MSVRHEDTHAAYHWKLLDPYAPAPNRFDEVFAREGVLRDHWTGIARRLDQLGPREFAHRMEQVRKLIRENGVTYNVYGDPRGASRPWALDPTPLSMSEAEWARIESGLQQRATLLDLVLRDLYGPQRLLHSRRVPPEFLFANPTFLRPCHGLDVPYGRYLYLYAADLARDSDGNWTVMADRTQAPSGAGYALENRVVMSRVFPNVIRDCRVQRLATFFERMRNGLREAAPGNRENPAVALLTPGPQHETYFEHSYLARYLGITLVEDDDLTVRDNCVYLKTLEGLSRIDVILRRLDDHLCDPLEFHTESTTGLVGLVQAVHAGNVTVANALGSGILESPALRAVLPVLCRELLGEDLKLASVPTWWCADPAHFAYVHDYFDDLIVAPAFSGRGWNPVIVATLGRAERRDLLEAVRAQPHAYVAQQRPATSTVPVWTPDGWRARFMMLRTFAVSARPHSYEVMPGGLTRFSESPDSLVVSLQRGGGSKDTWVQTSGPVDTHSLLPAPGRRIDIRRSVSNLPSRAADNLYWVGRYLERAEDSARTIRCVLTRLTDDYGVAAGRELAAVLRGMALVLPSPTTQVWPTEDMDAKLIEQNILAAVFDEAWRSSVRATFIELNRVAWLVRDRLSLDTWRILSRLVDDLPSLSGESAQPPLGDVLVLLNQMILGLAAFSGLATENMTRGHGWRFLDMGRRTERTLHVLELVRSCMAWPGEQEPDALQAALEVSDSAMTYRSRYGTDLQAPSVLDLLLTDESNPRSVMFQVNRLTQHLNALPGERSYPFASRESLIVTRLSADLRLADIYSLCEPDAGGMRSTLASLLLEFSHRIREASDAIARHYFSHTEFSREVAALHEDASE